MGNFPSILSRDERRRRSNRLSKPPTSQTARSPITPTTLKSPCPPPEINSPVAPLSVSWRDPWTGSSVAPESSNRGSDTPAIKSMPSVKTHRPRPSVNCTSRSQSIAEEIEEENHPALSSPTSSLKGSSVVRRASFRPTTLQGAPQSRPSMRQPKRSYSVQGPSKTTNNAIYESTVEEATFSNTHFVVDNPQRFSITRRRSLLTRPGVATRRSRQKLVPRLPPPIDQEAEHSDRPIDMPGAWPLPDREEVVVKPPFAPFARPSTPGSDFEYTHLGALRLGSLRVVNGSASPCSSDRVPIPRNSINEIGQAISTTDSKIVQGDSHHEAKDDALVKSPASESTLRPSTSTLHIATSGPDNKKCEAVPGSPFSFSKSPTITPPKESPLSAPEAEDEGIFILDDERVVSVGSEQLKQTVTKDATDKRSQHTLNKADSGYSSATSVRSLRSNPASTQQSCKPTLTSGPEGLGVSDAQGAPALKNRIPVQRHLSLHSSSSRLAPQLSSCPSESNSYPTALSTMCHDIQQMQMDGRVRSTSLTASQRVARPTSRYVQAKPSGSSAANLSLPPAQRPQDSKRQISGKVSDRNHYSTPIQGHRRLTKDSTRPATGFSSKSYRHRTHITALSGPMSARRSSTDVAKDHGSASSAKRSTPPAAQRPNGKATSLPTFPMSVRMEIAGDRNAGSPRVDELRGRTSTRSKRGEVYMTSSPFIFH